MSEVVKSRGGGRPSMGGSGPISLECLVVRPTPPRLEGQGPLVSWYPGGLRETFIETRKGGLGTKDDEGTDTPDSKRGLKSPEVQEYDERNWGSILGKVEEYPFYFGH